MQYDIAIQFFRALHVTSGAHFYNSLVSRAFCLSRHSVLISVTKWFSTFAFTMQVYARFLAKDHDSGRVSYFVSRRTWLKVTELVLSLMRVSDPRIASLRDRVLQGRSTGRTEVQVLSPITGKSTLLLCCVCKYYYT